VRRTKPFLLEINSHSLSFATQSSTSRWSASQILGPRTSVAPFPIAGALPRPVLVRHHGPLPAGFRADFLGKQVALARLLPAVRFDLLPWISFFLFPGSNGLNPRTRTRKLSSSGRLRTFSRRCSELSPFPPPLFFFLSGMFWCS